MMDQLSPQEAMERLFSLLSPDLLERRQKLEDGTKFLAHYTSAENALNIIKGQHFWLRNVRCMNDFSEVKHGINLLLRIFHDNESMRRNRLYSIIDQVAPGAAKSAVDSFDSWLPSLPHSTYIGCLSEFDVGDIEGRLSMWRAYGSHGSSVALVMNKTPFVAETDVLKAYSIPVLYLTDEEFSEKIDKSLDDLEKEIPRFELLTSDIVEHVIFYCLIFLALGLKHRGFREEEWRIVYVPDLGKSPTIIQSVECVRGVPQIVQKVPLQNAPEKGLHGANIANLVERVLIGPTDYPLVLFDAFELALTESGIANPKDRIKISDIPLR